MRSGFSSFAGVILAKESASKLSTWIIRRADQEPYTDLRSKRSMRCPISFRTSAIFMVRMGLASSQRLADALALTGQPMALLGYDGTVLHASASFEQAVRGALVI